MALSRAEQIARRLLSLPHADRAGELRAMLGELGRAEAEQLLFDWSLWGRQDQQEPEGEWVEWLVQAGRGAGKTRTGAEWIRRRIRHGARRIALVGRTASDVRDIMVEGESGLLSVFPRLERPHYEPSKRRVTFHTGAIATAFSSKEPDLLRGPQHDTAWGDEVAAWFHAIETLDNLMFGLRLGNNPRVIFTTTPKPRAIMRRLNAEPTCHVTRGSLYDNLAHLAPIFVAKIVSRYEGTRIGRQEIGGELLEDIPGALWMRRTIEARRLRAVPVDLERIVVAVDPPGSSDDEEDFDDELGAGTEAGIVVAGLGIDGNGYVLEDRSKRASPAEWALEAIAAFWHWGADLVVAERNYGGDMVKHTIAVEDARVPVETIHAKRGKAVRAEPVAAMFEPSKKYPPFCFLVGEFAELEDQLSQWVPNTGQASPDRLDAMVYALTELLITPAGEDRSVVEYEDRVRISPH